MKIVRIDEAQSLWKAFVAHLRRMDQAQWVVGKDGCPLEPCLYLAALVDGNVVGGLSLREQAISAPATMWSGGVDRELESAGGESLCETFVITFGVEAPQRCRGLGRALQQAALEWTGERGCLQMRSWSSLDKPENYALKLSMGFAMFPAVHAAASGYGVSGVYFVQRTDAR